MYESQPTYMVVMLSYKRTFQRLSTFFVCKTRWQWNSCRVPFGKALPSVNTIHCFRLRLRKDLIHRYNFSTWRTVSKTNMLLITNDFMVILVLAIFSMLLLTRLIMIAGKLSILLHWMIHCYPAKMIHPNLAKVLLK